MTSATQEAPVFDLYTLDDLYDLHTRICAQSRQIHAGLMDGLTALVDPLSDVWAFQCARLAELDETIDAVYAEIIRREMAEAGDCQACSDPACPNYVHGDTGA